MYILLLIQQSNRLNTIRDHFIVFVACCCRILSFSVWFAFVIWLEPKLARAPHISIRILYDVCIVCASGQICVSCVCILPACIVILCVFSGKTRKYEETRRISQLSPCVARTACLFTNDRLRILSHSAAAAAPQMYYSLLYACEALKNIAFTRMFAGMQECSSVGVWPQRKFLPI